MTPLSTILAQQKRFICCYEVRYFALSKHHDSRLLVKTLLDDLRVSRSILISEARKVDGYAKKDRFSRLQVVNQALLCSLLLTLQPFEENSTAAEGQSAG